MDLSGVISISGKPGLFKVVAQSKNNIIVESLQDGKRTPAYSTDRISALEDISIYTYEDDIPLKEVYKGIFKKEDGGKAPSHKESLNKLTEYLLEVLPNYDEDRVYPSDIKKLFQWYNLLHDAGLVSAGEEEKKEEKKADKKEKKAEEKKTEKKPAKKAEKKPAAKKSTAKKTAEKKTTAKKSSTKKS
tara:strand:- start:14273 stop:14836 length:564 start_codon:yes stop_codon:yes gene_type:complete